MADQHSGVIGLRSVVRDGKRILKMHCPSCGVWADIDADQFYGRTSILCACGWHETLRMLDESATPDPEVPRG